MSLDNKNTLYLKEPKTGGERRRELAEEPLLKKGNLPDPLLLEDIDRSFKQWVEENIKLNFEGEDIPTVSLFASQRFSEYMQSWKDTDEKKNFLMNFKVITRENNPKQGTLYENTRNIPGDRKYTINQYATTDENGRQMILRYKMKQPYCVDISYKMSVVTNKLRLLNLANELLNDKFKAITCYLNVNGHYMPMTLSDISDESDYEIDDRQYFSQTFSILVKGYIINEDSFEIEERPFMKLSCFENGSSDRNRGGVEIEEENEKEYKKITVSVEIPKDKTSNGFISDCAMIFSEVETENISSFRIKIGNSEKYIRYSTFNGIFPEKVRINDGETVKIDKITKENADKENGKIIFKGYEPYNIL